MLYISRSTPPQTADGFLIEEPRNGRTEKCITKYNRHTTNKSYRFGNSCFCGANGNRTSDTRIFSPLLYQLSYGTIVLRLPFGGKAVQKYYLFLNLARGSKFFFEKSCYQLPVCSDLSRETQNFTPLCYRYP